MNNDHDELLTYLLDRYSTPGFNVSETIGRYSTREREVFLCPKCAEARLGAGMALYVEGPYPLPPEPHRCDDCGRSEAEPT